MRRPVIALALAAEALAIVGWWIALAAAPSVRARFHPPGTPSSTVTSFVVAEAALVLALAVAAIGVWRQRPWAGPALHEIVLRRCSSSRSSYRATPRSG